LDLSGVTTYSVQKRASKVSRKNFATPTKEHLSFREFWEGLPNFLAAGELHEFAERMTSARGKQPILWMTGAHVLKVGLSPILIHLLKNGFITGEFFTQTLRENSAKEVGLGEAFGEALIRKKAPYAEDSLLVQCLEAGIPMTIHVAIGTDIFHEHPGVDGATLGRLSYYDFRIFAKQVAGLGKNGVVLNVGSAVIMPEVFLKALAVARNLKFPCHDFYTANFDMTPHYRPCMNVVQRPTMTGGKGYTFIGHHEIMIPLLAAALETA
jgi:hypothetical protein